MYFHKITCLRMVIAALFIIDKNQEQPRYPAIGKSINKVAFQSTASTSAPLWHIMKQQLGVLFKYKLYITPLLTPCCSWNKVPSFTMSVRPEDLALTYLISQNSVHKPSFCTTKIINSFHFQDLHWLFLYLRSSVFRILPASFPLF